MSNWTLLSNHGHVLVCLSRDPEARLRDVAADVGITERAVKKIVRDLQGGGMISVMKSGRRNSYRLHKKQTLRHQLEADCTLRDLIGVINRSSAPDAGTAVTPRVKTEIGPDTGRESATEPPPGKAGDARPAAAKSAEKQEKNPPDGMEKQQGTLF